jgi:putative RNA 2'-phosphotransferase
MIERDSRMRRSMSHLCMEPRERNRLGRAMSSILRHDAGRMGLHMDAAGWVSVDELLAHVKVPRAVVEEVVASDRKARFELCRERVRACQGHSLAGMPVTQEALEASWARHTGDGPIFHGTRLEALDGIRRDGIVRGDLTHVHLAASPSSRVGKRHNVAVLLEVAPALLRQAGHGVFRSHNGVILTRHVPPWCIVDMMIASQCSNHEMRTIRRALGLS